ncbi:MAG: hypothetical protein Q9227_007841 [Pyrenula ochraceoflavens]
MRARDQPRLNVLRSIIAEVSTASKGKQPITTDLHVLKILSRKTSETQAVADMYSRQARPDLKEKEESELTVLKEYSNQVQTVTEEDTKAAVEKIITEGATDLNQVMKKMREARWTIEGLPVTSSQVAKVAKSLLKGSERPK